MEEPFANPPQKSMKPEVSVQEDSMLSASVRHPYNHQAHLSMRSNQEAEQQYNML